MLYNSDVYINHCKRSASKAIKKRIFEALREMNTTSTQYKKKNNLFRNSFQRNDYWSFAWGRMLRTERCGEETTREGKYFRRRFRVPYFLYQKLVQVTRDSGRFCDGCNSAPLEVNLLHMGYFTLVVVKDFIGSSHAWPRWMLRQLTTTF